MPKISILDCTLRDGGHITNSYFGKDTIVSIINHLNASNIEYVEVGFLQDCTFDPDRAMYNNIAEVKTILPEKPNNVRYSMMAQADLYDISKLEPYDEECPIDLIRISFHDFHIREGLDCIKAVVEKGYKCFVNPINIMGYSDVQLLEILEEVNAIHPYGFTLVDTFGSLRTEDLIRLYHLVNHNLNKNMAIALHLHENLSLSFSLAQTFIECSAYDRKICIDGSLYGMGRVPGNLCIELIMEHLNKTQGKHYDIDPVYDAIDQYIIDIKNKTPWGYSTAYALSAHHRVHRTFAEYLMGKGKLKTKQINQILAMIPEERKTKFDAKYIEELYVKYQSRDIDDSQTIEQLKKEFEGKEILVVAPGSNILKNIELIQSCANQKDTITIMVNFLWDQIKPQYAFFTSMRRWEAAISNNGAALQDTQIIATSNLFGRADSVARWINYADYAYFQNSVYENSTIMLLNLLIKLGVTHLKIAGFDGFVEGDNFINADMNFNKRYNYQDDNKMVRDILKTMKSLSIDFITPSLYK